jgi:hypothetical protein
MYAFIFNSFYFFCIYFNIKSGFNELSAIAMSVLITTFSVSSTPIFIKYFKSKISLSRKVSQVEKLIVPLMLIVVGTQANIFMNFHLVSLIFGIAYFLMFIALLSKIDDSYSNLRIYSEKYYRKAFGEYPIESKKATNEIRKLIYLIPFVSFIVYLLWTPLSLGFE